MKLSKGVIIFLFGLALSAAPVVSWAKLFDCAMSDTRDKDYKIEKDIVSADSKESAEEIYRKDDPEDKGRYYVVCVESAEE